VKAIFKAFLKPLLSVITISHMRFNTVAYTPNLKFD
jgi:hypothetical protein